MSGQGPQMPYFEPGRSARRDPIETRNIHGREFIPFGLEKFSGRVETEEKKKKSVCTSSITDAKVTPFRSFFQKSLDNLDMLKASPRLRVRLC